MSNGVTAKPDEAVDLGASCQLIQSRQDFIIFLHALGARLHQKPQAWANGDRASYLEALTAWVEDREGYYRNRGEEVPEQPTWKTLGQILLAATVYE
jgi:hypothetical protein